MRDESAHLNSKNEVVGGGFPPVDECLLRRQLIKTVIELYSIELPGVEFQPFRLGQSFRVIKPAPVLIVPAAATDVILRRHIASPTIFGDHITILLCYWRGHNAPSFMFAVSLGATNK
jgi:hypothetical protein